MKQIDVPTYNDPQDFENGGNSYPCSTQYMYYNGLEHKYYLTEQALAYYGLDVENKYISDNPNKAQEFIYLVSKKVYDFIRYAAGYVNAQAQVYRVAIAQTGSYSGDEYTFRKEFERALVAEARWILENGDSARYASMEKPQNVPIEQEQDDTSDISTETKRSLTYLGLNRWYRLTQYTNFDDTKY